MRDHLRNLSFDHGVARTLENANVLLVGAYCKRRSSQLPRRIIPGAQLRQWWYWRTGCFGEPQNPHLTEKFKSRQQSLLQPLA